MVWGQLTEFAQLHSNTRMLAFKLKVLDRAWLSNDIADLAAAMILLI